MRRAKLILKEQSKTVADESQLFLISIYLFINLIIIFYLFIFRKKNMAWQFMRILS